MIVLLLDANTDTTTKNNKYNHTRHRNTTNMNNTNIKHQHEEVGGG